LDSPAILVEAALKQMEPEIAQRAANLPVEHQAEVLALVPAELKAPLVEG
jgi:hypothetical protein